MTKCRLVYDIMVSWRGDITETPHQFELGPGNAIKPKHDRAQGRDGFVAKHDYDSDSDSGEI